MTLSIQYIFHYRCADILWRCIFRILPFNNINYFRLLTNNRMVVKINNFRFFNAYKEPSPLSIIPSNFSFQNSKKSHTFWPEFLFMGLRIDMFLINKFHRKPVAVLSFNNKFIPAKISHLPRQVRFMSLNFFPKRNFLVDRRNFLAVQPTIK